MKYILLALLFTSCVTPRYGYKPTKRNYDDMTTSERIATCTYRLIEKDGVEAEKAQKTCDKIFRRG